MSVPFTGSIVGTWRIVRSTRPDFPGPEPLLHHYTADEKTYWEVCFKDGRLLCRFRCRISSNLLTTLIGGKEETTPLFHAEDGSVEVVDQERSQTWWMVRQERPENGAIVFVGPDGLLKKLESGRHGGRADSAPEGLEYSTYKILSRLPVYVGGSRPEEGDEVSVTKSPDIRNL